MRLGRPSPHSATAPWIAGAALALALHGAMAWWFMRRPEPPTDTSPNGALVIELAPIAVARMDLPADFTPGPDQTRAVAPPPPAAAPEQLRDEPPTVTSKPEPTTPIVQGATDVALPPPEQNRATVTQAAPPPVPTAPDTSAAQVESKSTADIAAAIIHGTPRLDQAPSLTTWTTRLLERLERNKKYPVAARNRRQEGTAHVLFSIDRAGRLLSAKIQKSSGSSALDGEALDLLKRSAPFTNPPQELAGDHIPFAVPIIFRIR